MTILEQLAHFVTEADFASLPAGEQETARRHAGDAIIAMVAGLQIPEGRALLPLARHAALPDRIGFASAAARLTEIDDIHLPSCTTPSALTVPVGIGIAAQQPSCDLAELESAIWVGTEAVTRLGAALSGPRILYQGVWPTYIAAPMGAAAIAARLGKLDKAQTTHALSLALMLASGNVGQFRASPSGRWFLFAMAVALGIRAAAAAQEGFVGDTQLLDGSWFRDTHGLAFDSSAMPVRDMRRSVYPALSLKPYCSSKQSIASIEALRRIIAAGAEVDAISSIVVRVPPPYANMVKIKAMSGARSSTLVSVAHQLAVAAYQPDGLYDIDRSQPITDDRLGVFERKVEIVPDESLMSIYPSTWPAELDVTVDGTRVRQRVEATIGDPGHALKDEDVQEKAHRVLDGTLGARGVNDWFLTIDRRLEGTKGFRTFMQRTSELALNWGTA